MNEYKNAGIFETVLYQNKEYVRLINENVPAEVQMNQLKTCEILMRTMILEAGLASEYKTYCDMKAAIGQL